MEQTPKQKASGWSHDATRALISIWGESDVQEKLDGVKRNKDIYLNVSRKLQVMGYSWTWQQCRTKIKNLTQNYRKIKDSNRKTGQGRVVCPFYEELDAILGTRAASAPPTLLESSEHVEDNLDGDNESGTTPLPDAEEGSDSDRTRQQSPDVTPQGHDSNGTDSTGSDSARPSTPSETLRKKGTKRKRSEVPSELLTLLTEMEDKAEERELKRMKFEAELEEKRNKEERNHEERMQSMMMGFMSHMMTMFSGSRVPTFPNPNQPCSSFAPSSIPPYHPMSHFDNTSQGYSPNDSPFHDEM